MKRLHIFIFLILTFGILFLNLSLAYADHPESSRFFGKINNAYAPMGTIVSPNVKYFQSSFTTVTFNANGGSGSMSPQTADVPTALTPNSFTRTGYSFSGWNTASDGSGTAYADGSIYDFSADITLFAQWTANNYTVTFSANGGSGSMSPQTANVPTSLTSNTFTRTGYTFNGWNTASDGSGAAYADGATYSFAADITLYAQWVALPQYTVTFNANGGSGSMSPQTANVPTL